MHVMKASDLAVLWDRPDNSRLTPKQVSVRLPVHVAAKLRALEELYPSRTRTEIVGDLLGTAIDELSNSFTHEQGEQVDDHPELGPIYEDVGMHARFRLLANKHYEELEAELGNTEPKPLYNVGYLRK